MGKGLGFQKKIGSFIDQESVERVYVLKSKELTEKFKKLHYEVPMEYTIVAEKIIKYAESIIGKILNESIYVILTDHIYYALDRCKKGLIVKNGLLWETK
jgi:beta-glucoside operon transcriptional antiterminator